MFEGISTIPNWFYALAFAVIVLLILFIEWKTR